MSDLSQISEDLTNKHEEISLTNDQLKFLSDEKSISLETKLEPKTPTEDQSSDKNDSEYEDIEDDDLDEINDRSILTSISLKKTKDDNEIHIDIKPRRLINKKRQDDEQSEGYEDDDNQNVPNTKCKTTDDTEKSDKIKEIIDDDNNTQSPAYIPRKGKFYEHDDRTFNENNRTDQELSKHENRLYKHSDSKWPHDLYFQDEQKSTSRRSVPKQDRDHFQHAHTKRLHVNDYMPRAYKEQNGYQQKQYLNNYRPRVPRENYNHNRINSFDLKDYNHSLLYHRNSNNSEGQVAPRRQQRDDDPYQIDERTFHRRRSFINSQFQQQDQISKLNKNNSNRTDRRQLGEQINGNEKFKDNYERKHELYDNKNNLPPRLQISNNNKNRNLIQKQSYPQKSSLNLSSGVSTKERPKRYSDMRNNMANSIQHYQDQRSNKIEQNDWPQAPPPPTSYLPHQLLTPQMFYQQQSSRYIPMNYPQTSVSQQLQENK